MQSNGRGRNQKQSSFEPLSEGKTFQYDVGETVPGTPYNIQRHIAVGGMGTVYEVEDTTVGKKFVLKTLRGRLASRPETVARMKAEAKILGQLTHANIVQVFTAGVTGDSLALPFIVMERLVGMTLGDLLKSRGDHLTFRESTVITLDLLNALEQAHELGLIHRDIKPDNVFIHTRDGAVVTKLLDFGVADLVATANREMGLFYGTVRYASPEQIACEGITLKSDLYSLGLVLFEMLAGYHPFDDGDRHPVERATIFPSSWPEPYRALLGSALQSNAQLRPGDAWKFGSLLRRAASASHVEISPLAAPMLELTPSDFAPDTVREPTLGVALDEVIPSSRIASTRAPAKLRKKTE